MSLYTQLLAGRNYIKTTLADITLANSYTVELKSATGKLTEDPLKVPDSLLPKAWVYSLPGEGPTVQRGETFGMGKATLKVNVDIWFPLGVRDGNGDEWDEWLSCVYQAFAAASLPATAGLRVQPSGDAEYGLSQAGRAILRVPFSIMASFDLRT